MTVRELAPPPPIHCSGFDHQFPQKYRQFFEKLRQPFQIKDQQGRLARQVTFQSGRVKFFQVLQNRRLLRYQLRQVFEITRLAPQKYFERSLLVCFQLLQNLNLLQ